MSTDLPKLCFCFIVRLMSYNMIRLYDMNDDIASYTLFCFDAACAIENGASVATYDKHFSNVPGLLVTSTVY